MGRRSLLCPTHSMMIGKSLQDGREHRILKYMKPGREVGARELSEKLGYSRMTCQRALGKLVESGKVEQLKNRKYRIYRPTFEQLIDEEMKDCSIVAYAPLSPVIAGAHAVLSGSHCLTMPLNAYVAIGLEETEGRGGQVICGYPETLYYHGSESLTVEGIQGAARYLIQTINDSTKYDLGTRPNYNMKIVSTFDVSQGCGGSAAFAVAGSLCFLFAFGVLDHGGPFSEVSHADFSRLFDAAFKVEQFIHGKGRISEDAAPFSSGSSVFGALVGNEKAKLYEYWLKNISELKGAKAVHPEYGFNSICRSLPVENMFLVLGQPKSTAVCHQHVARLKRTIKKDLTDGFFELWKVLVKEMAAEFQGGPSAYASRLLTMQNGLYMSLGLGNEDFSRLISRTSTIDGMGGSIVGSGRGGTCLLLAPHGYDADDLKQTVASVSPRLALLKGECLKSSAGARLIRPRQSGKYLHMLS